MSVKSSGVRYGLLAAIVFANVLVLILQISGIETGLSFIDQSSWSFVVMVTICILAFLQLIYRTDTHTASGRTRKYSSEKFWITFLAFFFLAVFVIWVADYGGPQ